MKAVAGYKDGNELRGLVTTSTGHVGWQIFVVERTWRLHIPQEHG